MYTSEIAHVRQAQHADDVTPDGLLLVILTPVYVRSPGTAGTVEDPCGLDSFNLFNHAFSILHSDGGRMDNLTLSFKHVLKVTSDPAPAAPDEEHIACGSRDSHVRELAVLRLIE